MWLTPANASNSWALAVRRDVARANNLKTMSDFGRWVAGGGKVVLACSAEFANGGTLRSLEKTYGFTMKSAQLIVLAGGETSATIGAAAGAHRRHQYRHGVRHRRRHRRGEPADPGG